jgi:hypothetical protein
MNLNKEAGIHHIQALLLLISIAFLAYHCSSGSGEMSQSASDANPHTVERKRIDGTRSSVNQVDEMGMVHGIRLTYYPDGKTVHTKLTFNHGIKHGPAIRYYHHGQVFEHTGYKDGKKHGLTRKYHKNGMLMAEFKYENGIVKPGLKEYDTDGTLVTSYPEIRFIESDQLTARNRLDVEMSCSVKGVGVKYYLIERDKGKNNRTYLISENGKATLQFYIRPGESLNKTVEIEAEIPTDLGNILVQTLTYHLSMTNNAPPA